MMCSTLPCEIRIGIIGGGQLGLMLYQQGIRLGFKFNVLGRSDEPLCKYVNCYENRRYEEFVENSDIVTFEFEHGNYEAMELAQKKGKLRPDISAVNLKREREREFTFLKKNGIPLPRFEIAKSGKEALEILKNDFDGTGVLKRSSGGYDGKGQYFIKGDIEKYKFLEQETSRFVVEELINFDYEASIIASNNGKYKIYYPASFNLNEKGILIMNYGPISLNGAQEIAEKIMNSLNYIGTIGVELFVKNGQILVNEFSPRVHNSGHYTLDACTHSQFESHLRAISGLDLENPKCIGAFGMINILGINEIPQDLDRIGKVFMYSKEGSNPRRKVGHINVVGDSLEEVKIKLNTISSRLYGSIEKLVTFL